MREEAASSRPSAPSGAASFALLVLGGLSLFDLFGEAAATGMPAVGDPLDVSVERAVHDAELFRALRDATPAEARVFFLGDPTDVGTHLAFSETEPLVFPRRFFRVETIPEGWEPGQVGDVPVCAVTYGALRDLDLSAFFALIAEGERFRVWGLKSGG